MEGAPPRKDWVAATGQWGHDGARAEATRWRCTDPGLNKRRRAFYVQPTITGLPMDAAFPELQMSNFVATWEVLDLESFEVGVTVFRTTGTFKIGDASKVDLAFWLPSEADALDNLVFEPSDEGIDLPIPKEESDVEPLRG